MLPLALAISITLTAKEAEVVQLLNEARAQPAAFAERYLRSKQAAECAREMRGMRPIAKLEISPALCRSARDHAIDMGRAGRTGHTGTDESSLDQRISRHGIWRARIAENIYYGGGDSLEIVVQLLIDAGVAGRGHRRNILDPELRFVGVSIRPHSDYGSNCVQDFAAAISEP